VDDGAVVETRRELLLQISALVFDAHFALFGDDRAARQCAVSVKKLLAQGWTTRAALLGIIIDTNHMVLELPADKQRKLTLLLFEAWAPARRHASVHDIEVLVGTLRFAAMCVPLGLYFLWRFIALLKRYKRGAAPRRSVPLSAAFHADLAWWRWLISRIERMVSPLYCPLWQHVLVPPHLTVASDASRLAMGGCCESLGWWWCVEFPQDVQERYNSANLGEAIWVNESELAGMWLNAYAALIMQRALGPDTCLRLIGDNKSAVQWISAAGTATNEAAGTLVRALGVLSVLTRVSFKAQHLAGVDNVVPDAVSRMLARKPPADGAAAPLIPPHWSQLQIPPAVSDAALDTLRGRCGLERWLQVLQLDTAPPGAGVAAGCSGGDAVPFPSS
jgi:hypothetical protein